MNCDRTYSILRSHRGPDRDEREDLIESGLSWDVADAKRERLDEAEERAHPEQTSWTRDLFLVRLEHDHKPASVIGESMATCSECNEKFRPYRRRMFEGEQLTCAKPECQRKRKTRLQRERREKQHPVGTQGRRGSNLPPRRIKGAGWGNALKQRRSTLPQPPEAS